MHPAYSNTTQNAPYIEEYLKCTLHSAIMHKMHHTQRSTRNGPQIEKGQRKDTQTAPYIRCVKGISEQMHLTQSGSPNAPYIRNVVQISPHTERLMKCTSHRAVVPNIHSSHSEFESNRKSQSLHLNTPGSVHLQSYGISNVQRHLISHIQHRY